MPCARCVLRCAQIPDSCLLASRSQFHAPRNLLLALTRELGELCEIFQWKEERDAQRGLPGFTVEEKVRLVGEGCFPTHKGCSPTHMQGAPPPHAGLACRVLPPTHAGLARRVPPPHRGVWPACPPPSHPVTHLPMLHAAGPAGQVHTHDDAPLGHSGALVSCTTCPPAHHVTPRVSPPTPRVCMCAHVVCMTMTQIQIPTPS